MEITNFVVQGRDQALLYGDYSTYHTQLTKRLLNSRKKLGIATKHRGKYQKRPEITPHDVAQNREHVYLLLLASERAWAQALSFKTTHAADEKGIVGRARSHIVSRLRRASTDADNLVKLLSDSSSGVSREDLLEAKAYGALIKGAMLFEKQAWEPCLQCYAESRVIYSALTTLLKGDIFKDLLSETIDPSIRYAAYQLKTPRTVPIPAIALKAFPNSDQALVEEINQIDSTILNPKEVEADQGAANAIPRTITWRSREVKIEDARIAESWGQVQGAKDRLAENVAKSKGLGTRAVAGAYDEVLMTTQDAVDATKEAIDELRAEGVGSGDPRIQSLQITRTAVNYEMISWRIGRNRVLTGAHDGATEDYSSGRKIKKIKPEQVTQEEREPPVSRKLSKLKEKAALYDGTLQNFDSIKELPGIAADEALATKIDAYRKYFESLKSLAIARSHAITGNVANALALINHSNILNKAVASGLPSDASSSRAGPLHADVTQEDVAFLTQLLEGELQRHRAIVHIDNLRKESKEANNASSFQPYLIDQLDVYPAGGVDLKKIVKWPPKMELIPVKPIFLDVAWNYIDYPGREDSVPKAAAAPSTADDESAQQPTKRGWFGFGRS